MKVDPQTQIDLANWLPAGVVRVAESGIRTASDIALMTQAGFNAFLIGESLMREPDPGAALAALLQREPAARI
jgi:indole-3-glycerol phosphate synthase